MKSHSNSSIIKHFVYKITNNINQKVYIGKSASDKQRFKTHLQIAKYKYKNTYSLVHKAINKHGAENFSYEELEHFDSEDDAYDAETNYILQHRSIERDFGYNLNTGGRRAKHSPESIQKISQSKMGHAVSAEARENMRISHLGQIAGNRKLTDEQVKKLREDHIISKYLKSPSYQKFELSKSKELEISLSAVSKILFPHSQKTNYYQLAQPDLSLVEEKLGYKLSQFDVEIKTCTKCKKICNIDEFYFTRRSSNERSSQCITCNRSYPRKKRSKKKKDC